MKRRGRSVCVCEIEPVWAVCPETTLFPAQDAHLPLWSEEWRIVTAFGKGPNSFLSTLVPPWPRGWPLTCWSVLLSGSGWSWRQMPQITFTWKSGINCNNKKRKREVPHLPLPLAEWFKVMVLVTSGLLPRLCHYQPLLNHGYLFLHNLTWLLKSQLSSQFRTWHLKPSAHRLDMSAALGFGPSHFWWRR